MVTSTRTKMARAARMLLAWSCAFAAIGCSASGYFDRSRVDDRSMRFDADEGFVAIRDKFEAAREGGLGGFGAGRAGGCACQ